ncbi:MAG: hypothetical protein R3E01_00360 [Pirellulaceae bacterium]|nr:hypothetical protein [Planctomycetales bacterium]
MAVIRKDLQQEAEDVVERTKAITDWRAFVRQHPWLSLGTAVAIGYFVVPHARRSSAATAASSEAARWDTDNHPPGTQRSLATQLFRMVGTALTTAVLRTTTSIVSQHVQHLLQPAPHQTMPPQPDPVGSDRPVGVTLEELPS